MTSSQTGRFLLSSDFFGFCTLARTLLGAPGLTTRSKDTTIGPRGSSFSVALLLGARTLLGAPGHTTS